MTDVDHSYRLERAGNRQNEEKTDCMNLRVLIRNATVVVGLYCITVVTDMIKLFSTAQIMAENSLSSDDEPHIFTIYTRNSGNNPTSKSWWFVTTTVVALKVELVHLADD
jgi:hypothetical protein